MFHHIILHLLKANSIEVIVTGSFPSVKIARHFEKKRSLKKTGEGVFCDYLRCQYFLPMLLRHTYSTQNLSKLLSCVEEEVFKIL